MFFFFSLLLWWLPAYFYLIFAVFEKDLAVIPFYVCNTRDGTQGFAHVISVISKHSIIKIPRLLCFFNAEPATSSLDKLHVVVTYSWTCFVSSLLQAFVLLFMVDTDIVFFFCVCMWLSLFGSDISIMLGM